MVFDDAMNKAERLFELVMHFWARPGQSFSTSELARLLGVSDRATRNYVSELSASGRLAVYREGNRWRLNPDARMQIPPVSFQLEEAAAVYLAARLLCRHSDEPNPAVRGAVARLATAVPPYLAEAMHALVASV